MKRGEIMCRFLSEKRRSDDGQGLVEYALILVLVAVVSIVVLAVMGPSISNVYCEMVTTLGGTCDSGGEGAEDDAEEDDEENDVVAITRADYNSGRQELHLDATSDGDYDASVTLTASPGGVMEARAHHYHLIFTLSGCPCTVTVTSSAGGSALVTVGP